MKYNFMILIDILQPPLFAH